MNGHISELKTPLIGVILTLAFFLLAAPNAIAATYYVATNGSDSNSCTQAQSTSAPKRNIMGSSGGLKCLAAGNGDTLVIRAGTYTEVLTTNTQSWPSGTSYANAATIKAQTGESVIIKPNSNNGVGLSGPAAYLVFDGLIVDGGNCTSCNELVWIGNGANHIRFLNTEIRNNPNGQNLVSIGGSFIEFIGGSVHDAHGTAPVQTTSNGFYGFYIGGKDNLIDTVKVYNCVAYGIHVYNEGNTPDRNVIRNSQVYNINAVSSGALTTGILLGTGTGNMAYNNVVRDIGVVGYGLGISTGNNASGSKIYNNTVTRTYYGITTSNTSGPIIKNNVLFSNTGAHYNDYGNTSNASLANNLCSSSGTGCALVGDPLFVDIASNNYALQALSPAIDRGTTLTDMPAYDLNQTVRPQGAGWDLGAYEYGAGAVAVAPFPPTNVRIIR